MVTAATENEARNDAAELVDIVPDTTPEMQEQQDTEMSGVVGEQVAGLLDESMESICESIERKCTGQEIGITDMPEDNLIILDDTDTECDG